LKRKKGLNKKSVNALAKHINIVLLIRVTIFVISSRSIAYSQNNSPNPSGVWYSPGLTHTTTLEFEGNTITRRWMKYDGATIDSQRIIILEKYPFRHNIYIIYLIDSIYRTTNTFYYCGVIDKNEKKIAVAFTDLFGYVCSAESLEKGITCMKHEIRRDKSNDRELPYINYYRKEILNNIPNLKNFNTASLDEVSNYLDTLIHMKQVVGGNFSKHCFEKGDQYFFNYITAKSLLKTGFSPAIGYEEYLAVINRFIKYPILKNKYPYHLNIKKD
jgi:hypothetical protein